MVSACIVYVKEQISSHTKTGVNIQLPTQYSQNTTQLFTPPVVSEYFENAFNSLELLCNDNELEQNESSDVVELKKNEQGLSALNKKNSIHLNTKNKLLFKKKIQLGHVKKIQANYLIRGLLL